MEECKMKKERLTPWQIEILSNKYREDRGLLANAIVELNRYLKRISYEMAIKQATPTLLGLLQAEFELTYEDELKLYLEFEEVPAETVHFEFLQWWDRLNFALKNAEPSVSETYQLEMEKLIRNLDNAYRHFSD